MKPKNRTEKWLARFAGQDVKITPQTSLEQWYDEIDKYNRGPKESLPFNANGKVYDLTINSEGQIIVTERPGPTPPPPGKIALEVGQELQGFRIDPAALSNDQILAALQAATEWEDNEIVFVELEPKLRDGSYNYLHIDAYRGTEEFSNVFELYCSGDVNGEKMEISWVNAPIESIPAAGWWYWRDDELVPLIEAMDLEIDDAPRTIKAILASFAPFNATVFSAIEAGPTPPATLTPFEVNQVLYGCQIDTEALDDAALLALINAGLTSGEPLVNFSGDKGIYPSEEEGYKMLMFQGDESADVYSIVYLAQDSIIGGETFDKGWYTLVFDEGEAVLKPIDGVVDLYFLDEEEVEEISSVFAPVNGVLAGAITEAPVEPLVPFEINQEVTGIVVDTEGMTAEETAAWVAGLFDQEHDVELLPLNGDRGIFATQDNDKPFVMAQGESIVAVYTPHGGIMEGLLFPAGWSKFSMNDEPIIIEPFTGRLVLDLGEQVNTVEEMDSHFNAVNGVLFGAVEAEPTGSLTPLEPGQRVGGMRLDTTGLSFEEIKAAVENIDFGEDNEKTILNSDGSIGIGAMSSDNTILVSLGSSDDVGYYFANQAGTMEPVTFPAGFFTVDEGDMAVTPFSGQVDLEASEEGDLIQFIDDALAPLNGTILGALDVEPPVAFANGQTLDGYVIDPTAITANDMNNWLLGLFSGRQQMRGDDPDAIVLVEVENSEDSIVACRFPGEEPVLINFVESARPEHSGSNVVGFAYAIQQTAIPGIVTAPAGWSKIVVHVDDPSDFTEALPLNSTTYFDFSMEVVSVDSNFSFLNGTVLSAVETNEGPTPPPPTPTTENFQVGHNYRGIVVDPTATSFTDINNSIEKICAPTGAEIITGCDFGALVINVVNSNGGDFKAVGFAPKTAHEETSEPDLRIIYFGQNNSFIESHSNLDQGWYYSYDSFETIIPFDQPLTVNLHNPITCTSVNSDFDNYFSSVKLFQGIVATIAGTLDMSSISWSSVEVGGGYLARYCNFNGYLTDSFGKLLAPVAGDGKTAVGTLTYEEGNPSSKMDFMAHFDLMDLSEQGGPAFGSYDGKMFELQIGEAPLYIPNLTFDPSHPDSYNFTPGTSCVLCIAISSQPNLVIEQSTLVKIPDFDHDRVDWTAFDNWDENYTLINLEANAEGLGFAVNPTAVSDSELETFLKSFKGQFQITGGDGLGIMGGMADGHAQLAIMCSNPKDNNVYMWYDADYPAYGVQRGWNFANIEGGAPSYIVTRDPQLMGPYNQVILDQIRDINASDIAFLNRFIKVVHTSYVPTVLNNYELNPQVDRISSTVIDSPAFTADGIEIDNLSNFNGAIWEVGIIYDGYRHFRKETFNLLSNRQYTNGETCLVLEGSAGGLDPSSYWTIDIALNCSGTYKESELSQEYMVYEEGKTFIRVFTTGDYGSTAPTLTVNMPINGMRRIDQSPIDVYKFDTSLSDEDIVNTVSQWRYNNSGSYYDVCNFMSGNQPSEYFNAIKANDGEDDIYAIYVKGTTTCVWASKAFNFGQYSAIKGFQNLTNGKYRAENPYTYDSFNSGATGWNGIIFGRSTEHYHVSTSVENGSYSGTIAIADNTIASVYLTADSGYVLPASITVINAQYSYDQSTGLVWLSRPIADVTITCSCEAIYPITTSVTNGSYNGDTYVTAAQGGSVTITPASGYVLPASVTVTGADGNYTYDSTTGVVAIGAQVGAVSISAVCDPKEPEGWYILDDDNLLCFNPNGNQVLYGKTYSAAEPAIIGTYAKVGSEYTITVTAQNVPNWVPGPWTYNNYNNTLTNDPDTVTLNFYTMIGNPYSTKNFTRHYENDGKNYLAYYRMNDFYLIGGNYEEQYPQTDSPLYTIAYRPDPDVPVYRLNSFGGAYLLYSYSGSTLTVQTFNSSDEPIGSAETYTESASA